MRYEERQKQMRNLATVVMTIDASLAFILFLVWDWKVSVLLLLYGVWSVRVGMRVAHLSR